MLAASSATDSLLLCAAAVASFARSLPSAPPTAAGLDALDRTLGPALLGVVVNSRVGATLELLLVELRDACTLTAEAMS